MFWFLSIFLIRKIKKTTTLSLTCALFLTHTRRKSKSISHVFLFPLYSGGDPEYKFWGDGAQLPFSTPTPTGLQALFCLQWQVLWLPLRGQLLRGLQGKWREGPGPPSSFPFLRWRVAFPNCPPPWPPQYTSWVQAGTMTPASVQLGGCGWLLHPNLLPLAKNVTAGNSKLPRANTQSRLCKQDEMCKTSKCILICILQSTGGIRSLFAAENSTYVFSTEIYKAFE